METTPTTHVMINNLVIDKKMQEYRDSKELHYFWDLFEDSISTEKVEQELSSNTTKYYGSSKNARNSLIRRELEEAKLFVIARDAYAKITCEKILQFFRVSLFSWSTGGKNYAYSGNIDTFKKMPLVHLRDLYNHHDSGEIENLSETIEAVIDTMMDEFSAFESVRACFNFYNHRPAFGNNPPIFRDCLEDIIILARYTRLADTNESFFQNASGQIRQYRDMLDADKNISEDYRLFVSASEKPTTQIRNDIRETLAQYLHTLVSFTQMQKKGTKNELKQDIESFLSETGYTLESLYLEISPTYRTTMDKIIFKRSGWKINEIPRKK